MALFLAGLRSVDQDLVKAAQIDGAGPFRIYRRVVLPAISADLHRRRGGDAAVRHQDLRPRRRADRGGPGIATTFPAIYVYDLMFQRGQIGEGAAAAIMMLLALAVVLVPYSLYLVWQRRRQATHE